MTFTFKLSRRLARFRAITWLSTILLSISTVSCSTDDSPNSNSWDPTSPSRATPLDPSLGGIGSTSNDELTAAKGGNGKGRGRGHTAKVTVSPASVTLATNAVQSFTATETLADGSTTQPTVSWTATGGKVDSTGRYTAGSTPGQFLVVATASDGLADTATAVVSDSQVVVARVVLSPTADTLSTGGTQQFTAIGKASDGSTVAITPTYRATGGTITAGGLYTAGQTVGTYRVIATDSASGKADTSAVTITSPSPTLQAIVVTPASVSLASGATQQFAATGKMSDGSTSSVSVTWSASGGTISSSGLYTAGTTGGAFRVVATQQGGTMADTSSVTITTPTSWSGSCARTVNVSTASSLTSAINNALPGDCIMMAPGSYSGGFTATRSGTAANPITLTGPRTAIVGTGSGNIGFTLQGASYWVLKGFRVSGPTNGGVAVYGGNYNVLDSLEVDHTGSWGINIRVVADPTTTTSAAVTGNVVRYSYIHDTGVTQPWGEGIYLGSSYGNQPVRNTYVHHNIIGPNVRAEAIETKVLADSTRIEFNTITGTYIQIRSDNNVINDNTLVGAGPNSGIGSNGTALIGIDADGTDYADNNVARRNMGSNQQYLFFYYHATNTKIYCDNKAVAPMQLNWSGNSTCIP